MNSWGRTYVDKYISKWTKGGTVGYRVFINRHDCKVNERFETLEKAVAFRDETLRLCELARIEKVKEQANVKEWPYNLIEALEFDLDSTIEHFIERYDHVCFEYLTERERNILRERYEDQKTLEEIGKAWLVTRERARQLLVKALKKMKRHQRYFELGEYANLERKAQNEYAAYIETKKKEWDYESAKAYIAEYEREYRESEAYKLAQTIDELDLSVRSYNCLKRAGIRTIEELLERNKEDLMKLRNLGRKSLREIIKKMEEAGYQIKGADEQP